MHTTHIKTSNQIGINTDRVIVAPAKTDWAQFGFDTGTLAFINKEIKNHVQPVVVTTGGAYHLLFGFDKEENNARALENFRKTGSRAVTLAGQYKLEALALEVLAKDPSIAEAVLEGMVLTNYEFIKYQKKDKNAVKLATITLKKGLLSEHALKELEAVTDATLIARDWVNEPLTYLTAEQLAAEIENLGKEAGFKTEVFNKAKIKALKMGGLLAVNLGSPNPPTFTVMEYKPAKAKNKQPIILVGKGVVYDTGGLSLKPTPHSMDQMKCDMGGGAAVACAIYAAAKAKLPLHIVGLVPATENRPGGNAYTPGDVIKMHSGLHVEVLNTDAEGRMILADALSYAKKYDPELVIDLATLTGAAARAIGTQGVVYMGTADRKIKDELEHSGNMVHERLVEFPLWEEYDEQIKSDIADIKNIGGELAGATTAGMFLKHFTDYPWVHIDIAGMAFFDRPDAYRPKNGTGVGVRLLFDFLKKRAEK